VGEEPARGLELLPAAFLVKAERVPEEFGAYAPVVALQDFKSDIRETP
jgi:hypothetical protein